PPLLYADAWLIPKRELLAFKYSISFLAIGLVLITTLIVGLFAYFFIPGLSLPLSFALGAVLSPTDIITISAIIGRLRPPQNIDIILKGESLINDASALVAFKFAIIAASTSYFSYADALKDFILLSLGGVAVGLTVAWIIGKVFLTLAKHRLTDSLIEVTVSILVPYIAYFPAEYFHFSGILAVVTAGLYTGWKDLAILSNEGRASAKSIWEVLIYLLSGMVFVMLGLQLPYMLEGLTTHSFFELLWYVCLIFTVTIVIRLIWVFSGAYLFKFLFIKICKEEPPKKVSHLFIISWAGLRGAITLAAALSIPITGIGDTLSINRNLIIFIAFAVTLASLIIQGTPLPYIMRKLKTTRESDEELEKKVRISIAQATINNLEELKKEKKNDHIDHLIYEYQLTIDHFNKINVDSRERNRNNRKNLKFIKYALETEKKELYRLYKERVISEDLFREIRSELDLKVQQRA
ncbi:MAG: Na+/H+ antiporter, partial [Alphaproteobacteria bacterium]|nr:Na+/H+ antiporter [Alphaproteobacteria bacterium]